MKIKNAFLNVALLCAICLASCDLQPKIASIPDSVGIFIEDRYPALLADPESQPEIYNSAVTDYGVYASPELYGSANIEDYVLYASVDDYVLLPETVEEKTSKPVIISETTVTTVKPSSEQESDEEVMTDYLIVPTYGGNTILDVPEKTTKEEAPKHEIKTSETKAVQTNTETKKSDEIIVVKGDTLYSLARKNNMTVAEFAKINNLSEPYNLRIGQKLTTRASVPTNKETTPPVKPEIKKEIPNIISAEKVKEIKSEQIKEKNDIKTEIKPTSTKRVDVSEIIVAKGDTLYSLSRKYEIPVNDLAVMNKLSVPFTLSVGQKIKVPKLNSVQTRSATQIKSESKSKTTKSVDTTKVKSVEKKNAKETKVVEKQTVSTKQQSTTNKSENNKTKISSDPRKQLPKIAPRSSSKFSWPLRGTILSGYGPKKGGLVNDGINISAAFGAAVRAAENGVVAYAGNEVKGMGNLIIIQHSDGWMTIYAHLNSMNVHRGTRVNVGDKIGTVGKTGKVDKPQLHFEIRKGTKSYNPTQYLKK